MPSISSFESNLKGQQMEYDSDNSLTKLEEWFTVKRIQYSVWLLL